MLLLLFLIPALSFSQEIKVKRTENLTRTSREEYAISGVSPDGRYILTTSPDFQGLMIMDLRRRNMQKIADDAGAGYEPVFSSDGRKVFYRSDEYRNLRKYSSLYEYDMEEGTRSLVEPASRRLGSPVISGDKLIYSVEGVQKSSYPLKAENSMSQNNVYVILEDLVPFLCMNGVKKAFKPSGEGNYIWVSLSPDMTKVLYNYNGRGTYVADTSGMILADIGRLDAPKWINDYLIAGMNDRDDGSKVLSSDICCYSLRSKKLYNLTGTADIIEMYPWPLPGESRIAFQTQNGGLFLMHIRIR
jgi:Tol biopolymer transport system component